TQQPSTSITGQAFATQPKVAVQDQFGNTVTTDSSDVTVAIKSGTGTSGAVLSGTKTVTASSGIATFSGLSINKTGTGYKLNATDGSLTSGDSTAFDINAG